jgi:hypothetical protein
MPKKPPAKAKKPARAAPSARERELLNRDVEPQKPPPNDGSPRLMEGLVRPVRPVRRRKPRKFTPETAGMICQAMRSGAGFARACALIGVSEVTGYEWLNRGKKEPEGSPYNNFAREVLAIRAELITMAERGIWRAALKGDVHAQKWLLKTQLPKEYGESELTEFQKQRANQELLEALAMVMEPEKYRELIGLVTKLQGSAEA